MMRDLLTGDALFTLFTEATSSIRRLSVRDQYDEPSEQATIERFMLGESAAPQFEADSREYLNNVRAKVAAGVRYQRVEVVPEPLASYLRFDVWIRCLYHCPAGEDVRYLARDQANRLQLPDHDFWTFDGERLVLLYFTASNRLIGAELVADPDMVARHEAWLDMAYQHATPHAEFVAADPERSRPPAGPT
jgi:hypothetical protein